jgi:hypothetical protein
MGFGFIIVLYLHAQLEEYKAKGLPADGRFRFMADGNKVDLNKVRVDMSTDMGMCVKDALTWKFKNRVHV